MASLTKDQLNHFNEFGFLKVENLIDPENIICCYGADAVRLFILSDSPPEKDVQWSVQGMIASYNR